MTYIKICNSNTESAAEIMTEQQISSEVVRCSLYKRLTKNYKQKIKKIQRTISNIAQYRPTLHFGWMGIMISAKKLLQIFPSGWSVGQVISILQVAFMEPEKAH